MTDLISPIFVLHLNDISIIGAIVVVLGLYLVVWGKAKERRGLMTPSPAENNFPEDQRQLPVTAPRNDSINNNNKA